VGLKYLNSPPPLKGEKMELKIWGEEETDTGYLKLVNYPSLSQGASQEKP